MEAAITAKRSDRARGVAWRPRGVRSTLLLGSLLVSLCLACAPASASSRPACGRYGGETVAHAAHVRVFVRRSTYYSCWLPAHKRTRLGIEGQDLPEHPAGVSTPVHVDGQYVVWAVEGVAEGGEEAIVFALNARTGRVVHELEVPQTDEEELVSSVTDVGVAADGSLVYLQLEGSPCPGSHAAGGEHSRDQALVAFEPGHHHRLLECESKTDPESSITDLRVVGQTVSWRHAGVAHTVALR